MHRSSEMGATLPMEATAVGAQTPLTLAQQSSAGVGAANSSFLACCGCCPALFWGILLCGGLRILEIS